MQRKKEERLHKQVEILQARLDQVKQENTIDNEIHLSTEGNDDNVVLEEASATDLEETLGESKNLQFLLRPRRLLHKL